MTLSSSFSFTESVDIVLELFFAIHDRPNTLNEILRCHFIRKKKEKEKKNAEKRRTKEKGRRMKLSVLRRARIQSFYLRARTHEHAHQCVPTKRQCRRRRTHFTGDAKFIFIR